MAITAYLTAAEYKARALVPSIFIDEVEAQEPGWTAAQLDFLSARIDSQLRKRYAVPFESPYPVTAQLWLEALTTERVLLRRGVDATDQQAAHLFALADKARNEIQEAADSRDGLYELPLNAGDTDDGVTKAFPLGYVEYSPYTASYNQRADSRNDPKR
jgi:phage gp36-like protein